MRSARDCFSGDDGGGVVRRRKGTFGFVKRGERIGNRGFGRRKRPGGNIFGSTLKSTTDVDGEESYLES